MKMIRMILLLILLSGLISLRAIAAEENNDFRNYMLLDKEKEEHVVYISPGESVFCRAELEITENVSLVIGGYATAGIRFDGLNSFHCNEKEVNASLYTLCTTDLTSGEIFELHISEKALTQAGVDHLTIEYSISLNENFEQMEGDKLELQCSMQDTVKLSSPIHLKTNGLQIFCGVRTTSDLLDQPLQGVLFSMEREGKRLRFAENGNGAYTLCDTSLCCHSRHSVFLRSADNGRISISGLGDGKFLLSAVSVPSPFEFEDTERLYIFQNGSLQNNEQKDIDKNVKWISQSEEEIRENENKDPLRIYRIGCAAAVILGAILFGEFGLPMRFISFPSDEIKERRTKQKVSQH